jgi:hypothetical protein
MGETEPGSAFLSHRDRIMALMEAGEPFGTVEDAIDASAGLTEDARAALWLFAFSMRDPGDRRQDARAHVDALA